MRLPLLILVALVAALAGLSEGPRLARAESGKRDVEQIAEEAFV